MEKRQPIFSTGVKVRVKEIPPARLRHVSTGDHVRKATLTTSDESVKRIIAGQSAAAEANLAAHAERTRLRLKSRRRVRILAKKRG
jgi:hypothetical protein